MDTSTLGNSAEFLISHKLHQQGLLVAKPLFDHLGTDLLVFVEMADGVKFCRVQSKGRSLANSRSSNIKIHKNYVSNGFLVFLYIEFSADSQELYIFFPSDIQQWKLSEKGEYQLNLSRSNSKEKLEFYKFDTTKVKLIETLIQNAKTHEEFRGLVYGRLDIVEEQDTVSMQCTVG